MKLYYTPSACSLSPHIVLREAGLTFDLEMVDLATKTTRSGENFLEVNAKGSVPALLLDSGETLTEGTVIVQYIGDLVPEKNLVPPAGTLPRYRLMEWLNYLSSDVQMGFGPLFNPEVPEPLKNHAKVVQGIRFDWINRQLADRDYLMGDRFCVADAHLFTMLRWFGYVGMDMVAFGNLLAFHDRIAKRAAVQEALKAEA